jgi:hypothetical protein
LKALEDPQRFEVKEGKLYLYVSGSEKALLFRAVSGPESK